MTTTDFIGRIVLPENNPPIRAYVHKAGFIEVYGNDVQNAQRHLKQVLKDYKEEMSKFNYLLASMWGRGENKFIDMFGYNGISKWPGNPNFYAWVIKNGVLVSMEEEGLTCEDTTIMLGKEAEHRRNRNSLKDFISNPPLFISDGKGHTRIVTKD